MANWSIAEEIPDYHYEITLKERSSRYIRTAFDYMKKTLGEAVFDDFLFSIRLDKDSSVFQHIYDDRNWNSYLLEVFIFMRMSAYFENPRKACFEFGVASGSGRLDQKQTLFTRLATLVPTRKLMRRIKSAAEQVSLISTVHTENFRNEKSKGITWDIADAVFDFDRLPARYEAPHWSTIEAGYGIIYGIVKFRKGLPVQLKITHWPILPSDLPEFQGKKYELLENGDVVESVSREVVGNVDSGPFEIDGVTFNYGSESVAQVKWKPETFISSIKRFLFDSRRIKKELLTEELRDRLTVQLNEEHQRQLAKYKEELTRKTEIIREKMNEIQRLKVQQDGDYFLTALLTQPFIVNRNDVLNVQTEFIVRQKKQFRFRGRRSQLGGDLCLTDVVTLKGKPYTFFVNSDAMGKSMQGAGGALVFGAVVQTFLARARYSKHQQNKTPEAFLKDLYYELQNAFITFDGSMLTSAIFGLVDSMKNKLYFINAEHPFLILYRDGVASFVDNEIKLHKLGVGLNQGEIPVETFKLQPGDIFIVGSDGKDDIALSVAENKRVINEDETAILSVVEVANANLRDMVLNLRRRGRITDDLSLLKISFKPEASAKSNKTEPETYEQAVEAYKQGDVHRAIAIAEKLLQKNSRDPRIKQFLGILYFKNGMSADCIRLLGHLPPQKKNDKILYYLMISHKKLEGYAEALEIAEDLALKNPHDFKILFHLCDLYRLVNNLDSAKIVLERLRNDFPENESLDALQRKLQ